MIDLDTLPTFILPIIPKLLEILFIVFIAKLVTSSGNKIINRITIITEKKGTLVRKALDTHTQQLIKLSFKYAVYITAFMFILYRLGFVDVLAAFLTGAGILGLAIGFASKDITSNMIAGVLLLFDRPFKIGDTIAIGGIKGKVKKISLRSTVIRSIEGEYVTIPNSFVASKIVTNYSKTNKKRLVMELELQTTNLQKTINTVKKYLDSLQAKRGINNYRVLLSSVKNDVITLKISAQIIKTPNFWEITINHTKNLKTYLEKHSITCNSITNKLSEEFN